MDDDDQLTLRMNPGPPDLDVMEIRVTPQHAAELQEALEEAGLYRGRKLELSAEVTLAVVLAGGWAGIKALTPVLVALINRHQGAKVEFYEDGSIKSASGDSTAQVNKMIESAERMKRVNDEQWRRMTGREPRHRSLDPERRPADDVSSGSEGRDERR